MAGYNNFIGYGYPNNMNYAYGAQPQAQGYFQQASGGYQQPQQAKVGIEWVDGEVGAKAFSASTGVARKCSDASLGYQRHSHIFEVDQCYGYAKSFAEGPV